MKRKRGPMTNREAAVANKRNRQLRKQLRADYLKQTRERAEWGIAMLKLCEAMGWPIVFRKEDLKALRKPCSSE